MVFIRLCVHARVLLRFKSIASTVIPHVLLSLSLSFSLIVCSDVSNAMAETVLPSQLYLLCLSVSLCLYIPTHVRTLRLLLIVCAFQLVYTRGNASLMQISAAILQSIIRVDWKEVSLTFTINIKRIVVFFNNLVFFISITFSWWLRLE